MKKVFLPFLLCLAGVAAALEPVAWVSDPPPAVDGALDRLNKLAGQQVLTPAKHTVYGKEKCSSSEDISGVAVLGYDREFLYLGATVTDDRLDQAYTQCNLWKGDHIMLVVQYPYLPGTAEKNLFAFGFSPGNFAGNPPEAWVFRPEGTPTASIRVAARNDGTGYRLEAAIPWKIFGAPPPEIHDRLRFDVLLSDTDSGEQDTMLSLSGKPAPIRPWTPDRLLEGVFARADGTFDPAAIKSAELWRSPLGQIAAYGQRAEIKLPPAAAQKAQTLTVRMAIDYPGYAGGTRGGRILFNGAPLNQERCLNRDTNIQFAQNDLAGCAGDGLWFTTYGPLDGKGYPPFYSNGVTINPNEFVFDIGNLIRREGENVVTIEHQADVKNALNYEISTSEYRMPANRLTLADAPAGELPVIEPAHRAAKDCYRAVLAADGGLSVTVKGDTRNIASEFSTLKPDWARFGAAGDGTVTVRGDEAELQSRDFRVRRTIERHDDHVTVKDAVTNLADAELPLLYRHFSEVVPEAKVFVSGYPKITPDTRNATPARPTALTLEPRSGLGLVAEDDLTRIQGYQYCIGDKLGLANERLLLTPGKTVELEFSVYPLEKPEQYVFINRIRDNWKVNFTIDGSWCFLYLMRGKTADILRRQLTNSGAKYAEISIPYDYKSGVGIAQHGNRFTQIDLSYLGETARRIREAMPSVKVLTYYHCFISNGDGDLERYRDQALITPNGEVADYGGGRYPIFVPIPGSEFAQMQEKVIDLRFAQGVDAIYWDELEYSKSPFSYSDRYWDGYTAEIDGRTHKTIRKITSVPLLTEEWRLGMIERLLQRGHGLLVANGAPFTRRMREFHFPRFTETGSITNLVLSQLYTPISLGDHLTVKTELDAYKDMLKALNYGSVYYYYPDIVPANPTLTSFMFPITPVALGKGYIIGRERILTNTSGLFGWGDDSGFTAHVFDRAGRETAKIAVPKIVRDGKTYAEVRIPEGFSAALVRSSR